MDDYGVLVFGLIALIVILAGIVIAVYRRIL
jgi:hypothetical protein